MYKIMYKDIMLKKMFGCVKRGTNERRRPLAWEKTVEHYVRKQMEGRCGVVLRNE